MMPPLPTGEEQALIQNVSIGERMIEITFIEPRDRGKSVMMMRVIAFDMADVEGEFGEFEDAARALLDAALLVKRREEREH